MKALREVKATIGRDTPSKRSSLKWNISTENSALLFLSLLLLFLKVTQSRSSESTLSKATFFPGKNELFTDLELPAFPGITTDSRALQNLVKHVFRAKACVAFAYLLVTSSRFGDRPLIIVPLMLLCFIVVATLSEQLHLYSSELVYEQPQSQFLSLVLLQLYFLGFLTYFIIYSTRSWKLDLIFFSPLLVLVVQKVRGINFTDSLLEALVTALTAFVLTRSNLNAPAKVSFCCVALYLYHTCASYF